MLQETLDLRLQQVALDGFRSTDGKTRTHITLKCAGPLRREVGRQVLALDIETLAAHPALGSLLNWVRRAKAAKGPALLDLLRDEQVLTQYLATQTSLTLVPKLATTEPMPERIERVVARLEGAKDRRSRRAYRVGRQVARAVHATAS
jgi:hypothetical protein